MTRETKSLAIRIPAAAVLGFAVGLPLVTRSVWLASFAAAAAFMLAWHACGASYWQGRLDASNDVHGWYKGALVLLKQTLAEGGDAALLEARLAEYLREPKPWK